MLVYNYSDAIQHHGIKGQRWGVRRYQNTDGSLTPAGRKRYIDVSEEERKELKLPKKWKYQKPETNVDAQKRILGRNFTTAATVGVGQVALSKYLEKKYDLGKPVSSISKASVIAGMTFISNVIVDEVRYVSKGVVRK